MTASTTSSARTVLGKRTFTNHDDEDEFTISSSAVLKAEQERPLRDPRFASVVAEASEYLRYHDLFGSPPVDHATERRFLLALLFLKPLGETINRRLIVDASFRQRILEPYSSEADGPFANLISTFAGFPHCLKHDESVLNIYDCICGGVVERGYPLVHTPECNDHNYCWDESEPCDFVVVDEIQPHVDGEAHSVRFFGRTSRSDVPMMMKSAFSQTRGAFNQWIRQYSPRALYAWTQQTFVGYRQLARIILRIHNMSEEELESSGVTSSVIYKVSCHHLYEVQIWGLILSFLDPEAFPHFFFPVKRSV